MIDLNDWIRVLSKNPSVLETILNDPMKLDLSVFDKMAHDDFSLRSALHDPKRGIIHYSIEGLVSLEDFLNQVTFEDREGYLFLDQLFETAIAVNRNKPVLFDPSYVFVSPYGDKFYFLVVPIMLEEWMFQKEQISSWVQYLSKHFKTHTAYEIIGYMLSLSQSDEFSLPNLISGLVNLKDHYYPKKRHFFSIPKKERFYLKEPVHSLYYDAYSSASKVVHEENGTQVLGEPLVGKAYLIQEDTQEKFMIQFESTVVGRTVSCDIQLLEDSISLKHAEILYENQRYYIKDLKSRNKTFLNGKQVIRKMRLKEGMRIQFGNINFIFHETG